MYKKFIKYGNFISPLQEIKNLDNQIKNKVWSSIHLIDEYNRYKKEYGFLPDISDLQKNRIIINNFT